MEITNRLDNEEEDRDINQDCPVLSPYLLERESKSPFILILPGGGYGHRAYHEGKPVAEWLNRNGISCAVLHYRVAPNQAPLPYDDASYAMRLVRSKAKEWKVDSDRIGILGFSAGGHLAATVSNYFDDGIKNDEDPVMRYSSRPDLHVLAYPVITMGKHTHQGSRENLLSANAIKEDIDKYSIENSVTSKTPPAFIWSTENDQAVDIENSLLYASALRNNKIPFALHIFEDGRHGLGLAEDHIEVAKWKDVCIDWLRRHNFK
ncbi:alpha/beta hydrolase [Saliterribacillus persicus]|uniref:Acetyl esterase/lipase n=1 Tax=Saliterribacillus persicus TaxID=930114 RepID=A0A368X6V5_9BACI|nr:alpha/beta hydrolase [Saliterribacillus persicus]RCW63741.1 acetyl esterase/lipase [Saliterribacillus persicus]